MGGRNRVMKEVGYFVQWKSCAKDESTWELPKGMMNEEEEVERFHREKPEMPGVGEL